MDRLLNTTLDNWQEYAQNTTPGYIVSDGDVYQ